MEGTDINFTEMLRDMLPKRKKRRTVHLAEARRILVDEELRKLVDMDEVVNEALDRAENHGIVFIDEIDKIAGERSQRAPTSPARACSATCSRSSRAPRSRRATATCAPTTCSSSRRARSTSSKPSDLIPELQGRFPIRVELEDRSPRTTSSAS